MRLKINMNIQKITILAVCAVLFPACTTTSSEYKSENSFITLNGKQGESIAILAEKSNNKGETRAELTSVFHPGIVIKGNLEKDEKGFSFYITGADLFSNWSNGWTEAKYEASGIYLFKSTGRSENEFICEEVDPFELWDITYGEIRYHNTYYRGNDGIWKVKNRIDRIMELCRWLKDERGFPPIYGDIKKETSYSPAFKDDMELFLFPETGNFNKLERENKLAAEYYQEIKNHSELKELIGEKTKGSGILWRMDYTAAVLPQEFHSLRNSGTLWRDYEEAPKIFFSLYNIDTFFMNMVRDQKFVKTGEIK